jgi:two-component system, cell cycle response regulator
VVLLADHDPEYRASIAFHLALAGYPVVQAQSVAEVVRAGRAHRPGLMIVADEFDERDVTDLFAILAGQPSLADIPVITVSSEPGSDRLAQCLANGARDHVARAEGATALMARVDAVLRADVELDWLRRRNAELEFLGTVDPFTGLINRRHLEDELHRLAAGAARHGLPLSVVMARADVLPPPPPHAKGTRDAAILRELACLVAAARRTDDVAAVWDGRTVVVLLPVTPIDGARVFGERLRAVISAAPLRVGEELIPLTLSCAVAAVAGSAAGSAAGSVAGSAAGSAAGVEVPDAGEVFDTLERMLLAVEAGGGDALSG